MAQEDGQFHCLTYTSKGGLLREIVGQFEISNAVLSTPATGGTASVVSTFTGIWDTGATNSAISQKVVDALGLQPITATQVQTADGLTLKPVYLVNIGILNGPTIESVRVTLADLGYIDALIGMDIITLGDFSITNKGGQTVFSFRIPSQHTIDYVKEAKDSKS